VVAKGGRLFEHHLVFKAKQYLKEMLIKVKVFPEAGKQEIIKKKENSFEVWVKKKSVKGMANRAVITVLMDYFKIPREKIRLIKGTKQRNKIFEIIETRE
jgi:uncharacterized protein (TIGR00251 family)